MIRLLLRDICSALGLGLGLGIGLAFAIVIVWLMLSLLSVIEPPRPPLLVQAAARSDADIVCTPVRSPPGLDPNPRKRRIA